MKTLIKITLLAAILFASQTTRATNPKIHRVSISPGNYLEIITLEEEPVEEAIPGYEDFISEAKNHNSSIAKEISIPEEAEEEENLSLPVTAKSIDYDSHDLMHKFICSIHQEEETVNDIPFNTKEIFGEHLNENQIEAREKITDLIQPEKAEYEKLPLLIIAFGVLR